MFISEKQFEQNPRSQPLPRLGDMEGFFSSLFKQPFKTIQKQLLPGIVGAFDLGLIPPKMIGIKGHASNVSYRTGRDVTIAAVGVAGAVAFGPAILSAVGTGLSTVGSTLMGGLKSLTGMGGGTPSTAPVGAAGPPPSGGAVGTPSPFYPTPTGAAPPPPGYIYDPTSGQYIQAPPSGGAVGTPSPFYPTPTGAAPPVAVGTPSPFYPTPTGAAPPVAGGPSLFSQIAPTLIGALFGSGVKPPSAAIGTPNTPGYVPAGISSNMSPVQPDQNLLGLIGQGQPITVGSLIFARGSLTNPPPKAAAILNSQGITSASANPLQWIVAAQYSVELSPNDVTNANLNADQLVASMSGQAIPTGGGGGALPGGGTGEGTAAATPAAQAGMFSGLGGTTGILLGGGLLAIMFWSMSQKKIIRTASPVRRKRKSYVSR